MRRTNASLSHKAKVDPKVSADQRGHGIGVSLDEYTQADVKQKGAAAKILENSVLGRKVVPMPKRKGVVKILNVVRKSVGFWGYFEILATHSLLMSYGAGDGARTGDVQLGNMTVNWKQRTLRFLAPRSGD